MMDTDGRHTARVLSWLAHSRTAHVSHIFERVANLVNQEGRLITLQTAGVGMGPFSWEIPAGMLARIDLDTPVSMLSSGDGLLLGHARLAIHPDQLWPARPDWPALRGRPLPRLDHEIDPGTWSRFTRLVDLVGEEKPAGSAAAVKHLAGRGPGLTPTGDDLIMGLCYALWVRGWEPGWMELLAETAASLTTSISAEFLRAAAAGEATIHWRRLAAGEPDAAAGIWRIGLTSGRDGWSGFSYGLSRLGQKTN